MIAAWKMTERVNIEQRSTSQDSTGWPAVRAVPNAVRVRYRCGHAIDDAALAALRMWMLLAVATWFKHAEAVSDGQLASLPRTYVDGLLDEYKVYA